jgi:indolepyruvate ferredoxin oxidoreductase, alpha subunit
MAQTRFYGGFMERRPLLGDEALALGAIHSGLSGAYSYPGTPATEILEFVQRETKGGPPASQQGVHAIWSANEKVAFEEALGMSYAGRRAMVSFKHVGLNVAADPFMNSAVSGIHGAVVVASADDPGMHSSQNEQDSRVYANFAMIPAFEPSNGQEAYDMAREAFDVSERFGLPVMIRMVTRLAHSRSPVQVGERRAPNPLNPSDRPMNWTLLPANARRLFAQLAQKQSELLGWSEESTFNALHLNPKGGPMGVIASGIGINYFLENYPPDAQIPSYLKIGTYPIPAALVMKLLDQVDSVLILEDGYPFIETSLNGLLGSPRGKKVEGKLTGRLPRTGEINPDIVRAALGMPLVPRQKPPEFEVPNRPPKLCDGCPHIDSYNLIKEILGEHPKARVFSDIGCYTLAALPPYEAGHACIDMGASISMAMGAAQAGMSPVLATIGDSTFMHSGMTPLVGAAKQDLPMTVFILDNETVAMTGGQPTMATGQRLLQTVQGLGVHPDHVHLLQAHRKFHEANAQIVRREIAYQGLSVIIPVRECIVTARKGA